MHKMSPGREAACRAVFGTWVLFPNDARKNCPFVLTSFTGWSSERCPGIGFLSRGDREIGVLRNVEPIWYMVHSGIFCTVFYSVLFCFCSLACLNPRLFCSLAAAAAAASFQLCPTLCDPVDGSPPGSPVPGILQVRTLEWVAISFSNSGKWKVKVKSLSRVQLFATPRIAAHQAPPPVGFSRQEYWSGVPLPSPDILLLLLNQFWPYGTPKGFWSFWTLVLLIVEAI